MEKFLFYRMTYDTGFAPNPFGKYLTLATCTPNHVRANLKEGDWIVGVESKTLANKRRKAGCCPEIEQCLIYVARVSEILDLNSYFHDPRFEYKKYSPETWISKRGDNIYYIEEGIWKWLRGHDHEYWNEAIKNLPDEEVFFPVKEFDTLWRNPKTRKKYGAILQDIRGNRVFICKDFLYFGDKCLEFDRRFRKYLPIRNIKYCPSTRCSKEIAIEFKRYIDSLIEEYGFGKHGDPICYCLKHKFN